jgi:hypothetical protein
MGMATFSNNTKDIQNEFAFASFADPMGQMIFVDSVNGLDSRDGRRPRLAKKTIASAVAAAQAGDTIFIKGSFTEAVTIAAAKKGLRIIGADVQGGLARWTGAADAVCLTINAEDVEVANIRFSPPARSAGTPAAIVLGGAGYAHIHDCKFRGKTGSWYAIYSPVCDSDNVRIANCDFMYMNTSTYGTAILGVEAGGLSYSGWEILNNKFASCLKAIDINGRACLLKGNVIAEYGINPAGAVAQLLTLGIDLSGTSSGANMVVENQLGGAYNATLYKVGASGDQWGGNWNVISGGVTAANPS